MKGGGIMAVLSFHCQCYKAGALKGIDAHNRRLRKNHISNPDIDNDLSCNNRIYKAPEKSLYADCKALIQRKVIANGNRVRKDSNWIVECIFTFPEDLPLELLDSYNRLVLSYMDSRLGGNENLIEAVCHVDEMGRPHLHADYCVITSDNRLSSKTLITRDFIKSIHDKLPLVLQHHNFDVQRGESIPQKQGNLNPADYKKVKEREKKELNDKINKLAAEYNRLVELYNKLLAEAVILKERNIQKARAILEEMERSR